MLECFSSMKLISLNAYFGYVFDPLMAFIKEQAASTDVFCFQEMLSNPKEDGGEIACRGRVNVLQEIASRLPGFECVFAPMQDDFDFSPAYPGQTQMGNVIFYKKTFSVTERGSFFIYNDLNTYNGKDYETLGHNAVYLVLGGSSVLTIVNLHGNSEPASKRDTPKRLEQSKKVLDFLRERLGEKIVMGDFNLFPETESIKMFEDEGFHNLIKDYKITTTRGSHMRKLFPEYEHGKYGFQEFADYTFVSSGVAVRSFTVPDVPISDHLPMILEI